MTPESHLDDKLDVSTVKCVYFRLYFTPTLFVCRVRGLIALFKVQKGGCEPLRFDGLKFLHSSAVSG